MVPHGTWVMLERRQLSKELLGLAHSTQLAQPSQHPDRACRQVLFWRLQPLDQRAAASSPAEIRRTLQPLHWRDPANSTAERHRTLQGAAASRAGFLPERAAQRSSVAPLSSPAGHAHRSCPGACSRHRRGTRPLLQKCSTERCRGAVAFCAGFLSESGARSEAAGSNHGLEQPHTDHASPPTTRRQPYRDVVSGYLIMQA